MPVPRNFEITDWHLAADCVNPDGTISVDSIWLMEYFACDEYGGLAMFNPLYGFTKRLRPEWQSPTIDDSGSKLEWTHPEYVALCCVCMCQRSKGICDPGQGELRR